MMIVMKRAPTQQEAGIRERVVDRSGLALTAMRARQSCSASNRGTVDCSRVRVPARWGQAEFGLTQVNLSATPGLSTYAL